MSHIAVDLKVIEGLAAAVARGAEVSEDRIGWGLVRLWHRSWADKSEIRTKAELAGIFGRSNLDQVIEQLLAHGFLESSENQTFRVKGADQYLRIQAGRSAGGKASVGNLKRGKSPAAPRLPPGSSPADSRLVSGLSPSTEHRTPNTEEAVSSGPSADDIAGSFAAWVNDARAEVGLPPERPISDLNARLSPVLLELNGDVERLKLGYLEYLHHETKFWANQRPRHPLRGFLSQAMDFVPAKAPSRVEVEPKVCAVCGAPASVQAAVGDKNLCPPDWDRWGEWPKTGDWDADFEAFLRAPARAA